MNLKETTVYSYSRFSTFHNCQYEYYNTYVLKNKGIENVYTLTGSLIHDNLEKIYKSKGDIQSFHNSFEEKLMELDLLGIDFPNEKVKEAWMKDVRHFISNFNKIDSKMLLEKEIKFEVGDGIYLKGFVDAILPSDKGKPYVNVYDWKTSSKFSGKKLDEAGRQLLLYKIGLESDKAIKVDKVMWFMIKYVYVCNVLKNTKTKRKMCNRHKWVKEIRKQVEKELYKLMLDEFEIELLLDKAESENNLNCMPVEIQKKYWLEDCIVEYEVTDEKLNDVRAFVKDTVVEIERKNKANEDEWVPVKIDKYNSFYCGVLCGHRKRCKYYKQFLEDNSNNFEAKKKENEFENLFS
ncbi:PD-(D/E)XK nuclease family protein [Bacillus sp. SCS-151]|uniref:PD-(D/E)XK nuclease family protein n=1 Tax=Nanhaiella sioensis TaxID=3115293 RepID=UPI0039797F14